MSALRRQYAKAPGCEGESSEPVRSEPPQCVSPNRLSQSHRSTTICRTVAWLPFVGGDGGDVSSVRLDQTIVGISMPRIIKELNGFSTATLG